MLPPGTLVPVHPVAFLVLTAHAVYGMPVSPELKTPGQGHGRPADSRLLRPVARPTPRRRHRPAGRHRRHRHRDRPRGRAAALGRHRQPARRLRRHQPDGGRRTRSTPRSSRSCSATRTRCTTTTRTSRRSSSAGGKIGLQHDPLLYGAYLLNPFLVQVELMPMLLVRQGEVAVVKAFVGLPTLDTSGTDFKFGSIVRPGHRGIWQEPLRTGKYPINPRCYAAEIVPDLDPHAQLVEPGLVGSLARRQPGADRGQEPGGLRLHHRAAGADPRPRHQGPQGDLDGGDDAEPGERGAAPRRSATTSATRSRTRRPSASSRPACRCSRRRCSPSPSTWAPTTSRPRASTSRTCSSPSELVLVLTQREIAKQEKATFEEQERAQTSRINVEKARGTADMQGQLAQSQVSIDINRNQAEARAAQAQGEASFVELTGRGRGHQGRGDRPRRGQGRGGAGPGPGGRLQRPAGGARPAGDGRSSPWPTRWPTGTSPSSPRSW